MAGTRTRRRRPAAGPVLALTAGLVLLACGHGVGGPVTTRDSADDTPPAAARTSADEAATGTLSPTARAGWDFSACDLGEDFVADFAEGSGAHTPAEALATMDDFGAPDGDREVTDTSDDRQTWVILDHQDIPVGELVAVRHDDGLWYLEYGEWCFDGPLSE